MSLDEQIIIEEENEKGYIASITVREIDREDAPESWVHGALESLDLCNDKGYFAEHFKSDGTLHATRYQIIKIFYETDESGSIGIPYQKYLELGKPSQADVTRTAKWKFQS